MYKRHITFRLLVLLFALPSSMFAAETQPAASPVETLVTVLPDNLIGFLATSGGDYLAPAFDQSNVGKMWREQSVQTFGTELKNGLFQYLEQKAKPENQGAIRAARDLIRLVLKRPMIIGVGPKKTSGDPPFYGFVLVDPGNRRMEMIETLVRLEMAAPKGKIVDKTVDSIRMRAPAGPDAPPVMWGWVRNVFVLTIHDSSGEMVRHLAQAKPSTRPVYRDGLSKLPATGDLLAMYVDVTLIANMISAHLAADNTEAKAQTFGRVWQELGLAGMKTIVGRTGFQGSYVVGNSLITVPEPRKGIFTAARTLDLSVLDSVPAGVTSVILKNPDFPSLYDTILGAIRAGSPEDYPKTEKKIADFEKKAGFRIRQDLLAGLAGPTIVYGVPVTGPVGNPLVGGTVLVLKLKDAASVAKSMTALEQYISQQAGDSFQVATRGIGGRTFHFWMIPQLAMMQLSPCWTVTRDEFVLASSMSLCNAAVNQATTKNASATSVRSTEEFRKATASLPNNLIRFEYTNGRLKMEQAIQSLQQFWPVVAMMVPEKGGPPLPLVLPPASDILKYSGPRVEYAWFEPEGIRSHAQGTVAGTNLTGVAAASVSAAIVLPAIGQARQVAKRSLSASHLRQIGLAAMLYANDHDGQLPNDLDALKPHIKDVKILQSPLKPKNFTGPSYIFVPGQRGSVPPNNVLAYENPAYLCDGTNVLFADGHVQWQRPEEFMKSLSETYKRLGRPMPAVKFTTTQPKKWSLGSWFGSGAGEKTRSTTRAVPQTTTPE